MKAQVFRCEYFGLRCDQYGCHNTASWFIGNRQGPPTMWTRLCDSCLAGIMQALLEDSKPTLQVDFEQGKVFVTIRGATLEADISPETLASIQGDETCSIQEGGHVEFGLEGVIVPAPEEAADGDVDHGLRCPNCQAPLVEHDQQICMECEQYICAPCGQTFKTVAGYTKHRIARHDSEATVETSV